MKKIFTIIVAIIMIVLIFTKTVIAEPTIIENTTISEDYIPSENCIYLEINIISIKDMTMDELKNAMNKEKKNMNNYHYKAEELRKLGYLDKSIEIQTLKEKYQISYKLYQEYKQQYDILFLKDDSIWQNKIIEYPTATYVWRYLKDLGYNDYVCAGIIGNMMIECGGGTLDLQWDIYSSSGGYYGLCQWSGYYFPDVQGETLENQMDYLRDTIKSQIDEAGHAYGGEGFVCEDFLKLTDEYEAAICFAKAYERCAPQHVYSRGYFAQLAYEYFTN